VSVSDKRGIVEFVRNLEAEIIATEGTAKYLKENGIKVKNISDITGIKESRNLKTLHTKIYTDIFSGKIDVVVVNLYPFMENPCIENIDIGGVSLLRAAAKNYKKVLVLSSPEQYEEVLSRIDNLTEDFRLRLAREAFEYTASYDRAIAEWFKEKEEWFKERELTSEI